jgi:transposase
VCIINGNGDKLVHRGIKTNRERFLELIEPYRDNLVVAVECVFMWYWLADLCEDEGIQFVLGHALYMKAIHGGKAKNDRIDSEKIARLIRGGTYPMAYVYPRKMRAARDLLRRRNYLVNRRANLLAHIQNTVSQYNLPPIEKRLDRKSNRIGVAEHFPVADVRKSIEADLQVIDTLDEVISKLEWHIEKTVIIHNAHDYYLLRSIEGVGRILSMTILYEIEDIKRFSRVQDFSSYSRLVKCAKESAGKRYRSSDKKIGNAHLKWAFSEAAALFLRGNPRGQHYLRRLEKKHGKGKAMAILGARMGRAVYFMLKKGEPFNRERFYGN